MPNEEMLDRDVKRALDALDYAVLPARVDVLIQRARKRATRRRWRFAVAAGIMLAASAAAALPGSPVRRWIEAALGVTTSTRPAPIAPDAQRETPATPPAARGVTTFIGDSAEVVFTAGQDTGVLVVRLIPEPELRIRSASGAVSYQVRPSGILVNNQGSRDSYEVEVSASAHLRVLTHGRTLFERRGGVVVMGPTAREGGAYVVSLREVQQR